MMRGKQERARERERVCVYVNDLARLPSWSSSRRMSTSSTLSGDPSERGDGGAEASVIPLMLVLRREAVGRPLCRRGSERGTAMDLDELRLRERERVDCKALLAASIPLCPLNAP